jgi:hypothetical protein
MRSGQALESPSTIDCCGIEALRPGLFTYFAYGAFDRFGRALQLRACRAQGRHENDGVEDRPGEQAVLARYDADTGAGLLLPGKGLARFPADFNACNQPALAHVADVRKVPQATQ